MPTTTYGRSDGFTPDRSTYASGPRPGAAADEEREPAVVPTTACPRCHEVSASGKAARFDPIPPPAFDPFDPFDPAGRTAWLRAAEPAQKREVLVSSSFT
ncbi:hypothetical protein J0H58_22995 [bacterium]|nr:hypothetical protein [bacterium]